MKPKTIKLIVIPVIALFCVLLPLAYLIKGQKPDIIQSWIGIYDVAADYEIIRFAEKKQGTPALEIIAVDDSRKEVYAQEDTRNRTSNGMIYVFDFQGNQLRSHDFTVKESVCVLFSPGVVATIGGTGTLKFYDLVNGTIKVDALNMIGNYDQPAIFKLNESELLISFFGYVFRYSTKDEHSVQIMKDFSKPYVFAVSPNGRYLAAWEVSKDLQIFIYDLKDSKRINLDLKVPRLLGNQLSFLQGNDSIVYLDEYSGKICQINFLTQTRKIYENESAYYKDFNDIGNNKLLVSVFFKKTLTNEHAIMKLSDGTTVPTNLSNYYNLYAVDNGKFLIYNRTVPPAARKKTDNRELNFKAGK